MIRPNYTYNFIVTHIYDGDNVIGELDQGFNDFKKGRELRFYGINAQEIRKSKAKGIGDKEVKIGYDQRDALIEMLGNHPSHYDRIAKYQRLARPCPLVIQTIKDTSGRYGRLLAVCHKAIYKKMHLYPSGSFNINEAMRDIIGGVEFYDRKTYPADHPIRPPADNAACYTS